MTKHGAHVCVHVDDAGHDDFAAGIEHFGSLGVLSGSHADNFSVFNEHVGLRVHVVERINHAAADDQKLSPKNLE